MDKDVIMMLAEKASISNGKPLTPLERLKVAPLRPDPAGPAGLPLCHPKMERHRRFNTHGHLNRYDPMMPNPGSRGCAHPGLNYLPRRANKCNFSGRVVERDRTVVQHHIAPAHCHPRVGKPKHTINGRPVKVKDFKVTFPDV